MTLAGCKKEEACTTTTGIMIIPEEQVNRGKDIKGKVEFREDSAQIPKKKTDYLDKSHRLGESILQKKSDK